MNFKELMETIFENVSLRDYVWKHIRIGNKRYFQKFCILYVNYFYHWCCMRRSGISDGLGLEPAQSGNLNYRSRYWFEGSNFSSQVNKFLIMLNTIQLCASIHLLSQYMNYIAFELYWSALNCIALHFIELLLALHRIALNWIEWHWIALHWIALHCIELHWSLRAAIIICRFGEREQTISDRKDCWLFQYNMKHMETNVEVYFNTDVKIVRFRFV